MLQPNASKGKKFGNKYKKIVALPMSCEKLRNYSCFFVQLRLENRAVSIKKINDKNIRFIDNLEKKAYNDVVEKIGARIAP